MTGKAMMEEVKKERQERRVNDNMAGQGLKGVWVKERGWLAPKRGRPNLRELVFRD